MKTFNPEYAEAARLACKEAGRTDPEAYGLAYAAYAETFNATKLCPAGAAYGAALSALAPLGVAAFDGDGRRLTRDQIVPDVRTAERLCFARNRFEAAQGYGRAYWSYAPTA